MYKRRTFFVGFLALLWLPNASLLAAGFDAKVQWARRVMLSVPVSGVVQTISVDTGQAIKKGQLLLQLEQTPFATELAAAKAAQAQAGGDRHVARRDLGQTRELYERGLISNVELENAELKLKRAVAGWNAARARVQRAQYELAHSQIKAPFDGWLLGRNVQVGQSIISTQQAQTLLIAAAANEYVARAEVPGKKLEGLKMGDRAVVEVNGESFKGKISVLGLEPLVRKKGGDAVYEVGVAFNSGGQLLRAGQQAEVDF